MHVHNHQIYKTACDSSTFFIKSKFFREKNDMGTFLKYCLNDTILIGFSEVKNRAIEDKCQGSLLCIK